MTANFLSIVRFFKRKINSFLKLSFFIIAAISINHVYPNETITYGNSQPDQLQKYLKNKKLIQDEVNVCTTHTKTLPEVIFITESNHYSEYSKIISEKLLNLAKKDKIILGIESGYYGIDYSDYFINSSGKSISGFDGEIGYSLASIITTLNHFNFLIKLNIVPYEEWREMQVLDALSLQLSTYQEDLILYIKNNYPIEEQIIHIKTFNALLLKTTPEQLNSDFINIYTTVVVKKKIDNIKNDYETNPITRHAFNAIFNQNSLGRPIVEKIKHSLINDSELSILITELRLMYQHIREELITAGIIKESPGSQKGLIYIDKYFPDDRTYDAITLDIRNIEMAQNIKKIICDHVSKKRIFINIGSDHIETSDISGNTVITYIVNSIDKKDGNHQLLNIKHLNTETDFHELLLLLNEIRNKKVQINL